VNLYIRYKIHRQRLPPPGPSHCPLRFFTPSSPLLRIFHSYSLNPVHVLVFFIFNVFSVIIRIEKRNLWKEIKEFRKKENASRPTQYTPCSSSCTGTCPSLSFHFCSSGSGFGPVTTQRVTGWTDGRIPLGDFRNELQ